MAFFFAPAIIAFVLGFLSIFDQSQGSGEAE
jgi:hypothetical protein